MADKEVDQPVSYWTLRRKVQKAVTKDMQSMVCQTSLFDYDESMYMNQSVEHSELCSESGASDGHVEEFREDTDIDDHFQNSLEDIENLLDVMNRNDSDIDNDTDITETDSLEIKLADWAVQHKITHAALSDLLSILRDEHPFLPSDPRTLLKTLVSYEVKDIGGGSYYHFGVLEGILSKLAVHYPNHNYQTNHILLNINVDGLPIFKSCNVQFWPILGMIAQPKMGDPFVIGLFCGNSKPSDPFTFMHDFIQEMKRLEQDGFMFQNKHFSLALSAVICDAPARAFVKNVMGHNAYYGCERCVQRGVWNKKVTFPETYAELRSDVQFDEMTNAEHHKGASPFRELSFGMVSQFPLDYMHLVCLGVMRRLILLWMKGPLPSRIGPLATRLISASLLEMRKRLPREFARKPRSLAELERWKATELRQFLLYTGPLALLGNISDNLYHNFMLLSVPMFILLSPRLSIEYCDYAEKLLLLFVQHYNDIFGSEFVVYNVHSLVHLAQDSRMFQGSLDNVSAFPFENFMCSLKKMIRKPQNPLQQAIRRLSETRNLSKFQNKGIVEMPRRTHLDGPVPAGYDRCMQFHEIHMPLFYLAKNECDACVRIGNDIALICNILQMNDEIYVAYHVFSTVEDFFSYPLQSSCLGIYKVSDICRRLQVAHITEIAYKYVLLRRRDISVAIPLLHN